MPAHVPQGIWKKLTLAIRRDPRKAGILTVLVTILLTLQIRLQMNKGEGPSRVNAASSRAASSSATHSAGANVRPQDSASALRSWMSAPPVPLGRNVFAVNLDRYPRDQSNVTPHNVPAQSTQGFWDELAKSMGSRTDVRKERQILMENLQQQASQLRLQSTVMGASPKAVIDGELVGEGDVVASFRVLKIEARRILVEREGIRLEIQMK